MNTKMQRLQRRISKEAGVITVQRDDVKRGSALSNSRTIAPGELIGDVKSIKTNFTLLSYSFSVMGKM